MADRPWLRLLPLTKPESVPKPRAGSMAPTQPRSTVTADSHTKLHAAMQRRSKDEWTEKGWTRLNNSLSISAQNWTSVHTHTHTKISEKKILIGILYYWKNTFNYILFMHVTFIQFSVLLSSQSNYFQLFYFLPVTCLIQWNPFQYACGTYRA